MFQSFERRTRPETVAPRLAALRAEMARLGLDAVLIPRADAWQGEYVAPRDERLAWLTGFSGSAGTAAILAAEAALFVDGRYTLQAAAETDTALITPLADKGEALADWLGARLARGQVVEFDPWLHTIAAIERLRAALAPGGIVLHAVESPVDAIWTDRPPPPAAALRIHPPDHAGTGHDEKRAEIARALRAAGQRAVVLTAPDSIAWLLNIRGGDIAHIPVVHAFLILHEDARGALFVDPGKLDGSLRAHLGPAVTTAPMEAFAPALAELTGPVRLDRARTPYQVARLLEEAGITTAFDDDPCVLPRARKNGAEIAGAEEAHLIDGAAVAEFLCWLDATAPGGLTEIDVATRLEECRRTTGRLMDISFDTIAAAGPHGAIVHYRVDRDSNRALAAGELLLVDSGGQYVEGTTDITRTIAVGAPDDALCAGFTRVLKGLIALSSARWPAGLAGRDLDALARAPLWAAGEDYDHGTGHGVGSYLSVHEGPQRIARKGEAALEPGMIVSIEPGLYREGAFGIRIENLALVEADEPGTGGRAMRRLRTLTRAPIDRRLIVPGMLTAAERAWIDAYHAEVRAALTARLAAATAEWLAKVTRPL